MRSFLKLVSMTVLGAAQISLAAEAPSTSPFAKPTVLVLSFAKPANPGGGWIARAAKDDLVAALSRDLDATVRTPSVTREAQDTEAALKLGNQYHASYVINGAVQESNDLARITGQIIDVNTGSLVGALKATGPATQLFDIDDALTAQVISALPQSIVKPEALASLQRYFLPLAPEADALSSHGLAMLSQSYPVSSLNFAAPIIDLFPQQQTSSVVYIVQAVPNFATNYFPYGSYFGPAWYGPGFGVAGPIGSYPHRQDHFPRIHHGPARPTIASNPDGIVLGNLPPVAASPSVPVSFNYPQNAGSINTPFMGGGQSFPAQNGFVTSGASGGFSVFSGPRFSGPNFRGPLAGRGGR